MVAKEKGVHLGRPVIAYPQNWEAVYLQWENKQITAVAAMDMLGLKRSTFYKMVAKFREEHQKNTDEQ